MSYLPVTHVLFDMDGLLLNLTTFCSGRNALPCLDAWYANRAQALLVHNEDITFSTDTEELFTFGSQKLVSKYDKEFTYNIKCKVAGKRGREFSQTIIDELELPIGVDEFMEESKLLFQELYSNSQLLPGVQRLIDHLVKNNIPIGLATNSSKENYNLKTQKHQEFFDMFLYKTWGSDPEVKMGKPHPDIFRVALEKFPGNPKPVKCLVFEDSVFGVRAARAAAMQVVMVPHPQLDRSLTMDSTLVLDSLMDFQPELFGLPPFED